MTESPAESALAVAVLPALAVNIGGGRIIHPLLPPAGRVRGLDTRATCHRGPLVPMRRGGRIRKGLGGGCVPDGTPARRS